MKTYLKIVSAIIMIVVLILTLVYGKDMLGFSSDVDTTITSLLPGIFIVSTSFIFLSVIRGIFYFPAMGALGVGFAVLLGEMNDLSLISSDMLSGLTIGQVQVWCIVLGLVFGGIVGFVDR